MKLTSFFLMAALCAMPGALRAQDAATEERLNQLNAKIAVLIEGQDLQRKRIETLEKELSAIQQQQSKPNESYASQEDVKQLTAKLQEVDQNRLKDYKHISKEIEKLGDTLLSTAKKPSAPTINTEPTGPSTGFEYVVAPGDTLSVIAAAYKEKNIKVTVDQILKANPSLKPNSMRVGQKIFIPAPQ